MGTEEYYNEYKVYTIQIYIVPKTKGHKEDAFHFPPLTDGLL